MLASNNRESCYYNGCNTKHEIVGVWVLSVLLHVRMTDRRYLRWSRQDTSIHKNLWILVSTSQPATASNQQPSRESRVEIIFFHFSMFLQWLLVVVLLVVSTTFSSLQSINQ